ncbi:hypothetical protein [Curtobacterium ammoniigenes]|uniref:hypothetical protein n=1 Tax=Curtobacterium ammoniigenes TaxID=395387 RepID=UPI00083778EA|nr:hypothetical protein [Curtobacterium ammoniigenes]
MQLRILHLSPYATEDGFLGMLYLHPTHPSPASAAHADPSTAVMVRVVATPLSPGYALEYGDGAPATDPADPVVAEADRLVRTILQPAADVARRERFIRHLLETNNAVLLDEDAEWQRDCWRYVRGELDLPAFTLATQHAHQRHADRTPHWPFAPEGTTAQAWQDDAYRRHNDYLVDTSLNITDAAARLQRTVDDLATLVTEQALLAVDLGARTRIPTWQLHTPTRPGHAERDNPGERWELLPGLDVLIAAMPATWADTAGSTNFMTTPNPALADEPSGPMELRHPVSPVEWITTGRPLAAVIRLLRAEP